MNMNHINTANEQCQHCNEEKNGGVADYSNIDNHKSVKKDTKKVGGFTCDWNNE